MNMNALRVHFVLAALALAGCDSSSFGADPFDDALFGPLPADGVALLAATDEAEAGERVDLRLANVTDVAVGYNLCSASLELERRVGDAWERVAADLSEGREGACPDVLLTLEPGAVAAGAAYLPGGLAPGAYRVATGVEVNVGAGGEWERVATGPIAVRP